jgi:hypothetical protein
MIERNVWKDTADGLILFSCYEVITTGLDIVLRPAVSPASFAAGAAMVASLLFVDFFISETAP